MANIIIYYSRTGENYWAGGVKDISKGNTERVAEFIQQAVGGDLFEVRTVKEYPADYYPCIDEAKAELRQHARPAVVAIPDVAGYDTIFMGYPNWWGTMPMCMYTLVEALAKDGGLEGKRICPFCTNEGSGLGGSVRELKKIATGATVERGLSITGHRAAESRDETAQWAKALM